VSAIENGKVVDTSMGMTPMEGLIMGTRCGDMDPTIVEYLAHCLNKSLEEVMTILNKESGVYGLSGGVSSDFRDLEAAANDGNKKAELAIEVFSYRTAKYIGAYIASLNGVDAIAFTAGLGENQPVLRQAVCDYLKCLGVEMDYAANDACIRGKEGKLSTDNSKIRVELIATNEELVIARDTKAIVEAL
jgi:acetate kinase